MNLPLSTQLTLIENRRGFQYNIYDVSESVFPLVSEVQASSWGFPLPPKLKR